MSGTMNAATRYLAEARARLERLLDSQPQRIEEAVEAIVEALDRGGRLYLFGTGHSHLLAEEGHYRAGGLAAVVPILHDDLMLHRGAVVSCLRENTPGLADQVLGPYGISSGDVLFVFSNSGANLVAIEAAKHARGQGARVVGLLSSEYFRSTCTDGEGLATVADIVLDNHAPHGDAAVFLESHGVACGPISTVTGAALLNAVLVEVTSRMSPEKPLVYRSSRAENAGPGNAELVHRYRARNPHL